MSEAGSPKAVVFDVGNVLFHWDLAFLFDKIIPDEQRRARFLDEVLTFEFHTRHDRGEHIDVLVEELQARHPEFAAEAIAYRDRFNETISGPVEGTHELARRLKAEGVPLFALTNFGVELWQGFVPTAPILDLFDDIVVSGAEKLAKPDPAIYRLSQRRFGHAAEELFFIDDRPDNIAAARACGWHGHVFTGADTLEADLVRHQLLRA